MIQPRGCSQYKIGKPIFKDDHEEHDRNSNLTLSLSLSDNLMFLPEEWQIHVWSVFAVLILQFFPLSSSPLSISLSKRQLDVLT